MPGEACAKPGRAWIGWGIISTLFFAYDWLGRVRGHVLFGVWVWLVLGRSVSKSQISSNKCK
jgi:hypothetical protein